MRKIVRIVILILSGAIFLGSAGILLHYWWQDRSDARVREQLAEMISGTGDVSEQLQALRDANPDTVGWLRIDDTTIDYVVMQAPYEKEKYLHLDFNGTYSARGTLYVDERCDMQTADNLIIYGHHMNDGSMFGALTSYQDASYYSQHPTITFDTIYGTRTYEIVAAINTRILGTWESGFKYYEYTESGDEMKFWQYVDFINQNRLYDTGVSLQPGDRLLTLSTCAYHTTDGRFIVVAREVQPETTSWFK